MAREAAKQPQGQQYGNRAAIYARVSDKSQDGEDKTSISEQISEMEAYCEEKGLTITARYQEVGRGWSKKRPEFQRILADAKQGRFDVIVCWKSDRLSRGMYTAAALMEVVEAHQVRLESVMDAIDMKTFGLMAAIGKIELDNFRERATLGKRGTAKQGRVPTGKLPYGYRIGDDGRPVVVEEQAEVVRRIFNMYVHEGMGSPSIAVRLTDDGIPTQTGKMLWRQSYIHYVLRNETYTGTWIYGKERVISTEEGVKVYQQPEDTWIEVPVPQIIDDETWERAQTLKKQRSRKARRNTKETYLLQHLLRCGECGHSFHAKSTWSTTNVRGGKKYRYDLPTPRRYYRCNGMHSLRLKCRARHYIRAERLEEPVWSEVSRVLQNPGLIVAGIDTLDTQENGGFEEEMAQAERDVRSIQTEEDRAIRLFVSGKITEAQLDHQRRYITERLESARAKLDYYRAQEASGAEKRLLMDAVLAWAREVGKGLDDLTDEQRREILQMVVEQVVIDRDNNVDITLAIPIDDDPLGDGLYSPDSPTPDSVAVASAISSSGNSAGSPANGSTPWPSSPCSASGASG
ncbi:MAG: recombinase family protein [Chloroflexota bacterium]|nr:recombinase family protein [Chloroflexota bacterium]